MPVLPCQTHVNDIRTQNLNSCPLKQWFTLFTCSRIFDAAHFASRAYMHIPLQSRSCSARAYAGGPQIKRGPLAKHLVLHLAPDW